MDEGTDTVSTEFKESFYNFKLVLEDGRLISYNTKTGVVSIVDTEQSGFLSSLSMPLPYFLQPDRWLQ